MSAALPLPLADSPEAHLLSRARRGDFAAFTELVAPHLPRLKRLLSPVAGGSDAAEDLVSETLLRAFRNLHRYEDRRLGTWLHRIGTNLAVSGHRRDAVDRRTRDRWPELRPTVEPRDPAELAEERESLDLLHGALQDLPPRYREILDLRFARELSCSEIADRLGTTANGVSLVIHRAKRRLKDALAPA